MREPSASAEVFGLLAEFSGAEELVEGVKQARQEGFSRLDAFTPFPVPALSEALGVRDNRVSWAALAGGIAGAVLGYGMQVYTNHAYPLPVGNRPLTAPPAFMLITFEMTVLGAVLAAILAMLLLNRLPRLNHPLFGAERFSFGAEDRFFLVVFSDDAMFGERETGAFLQGIGARSVETVRRSKVPA